MGVPEHASSPPVSGGGRGRLRSAGFGALSAVFGVVIALSGFYPLGRVFDRSVGGDQPAGLAAEFALGVIFGVMVSPVSAALGAATGLWVGDRRIGRFEVAIVEVLAVAVAVCSLIALSGGRVGEAGGLATVWHVITLGALAGAAAIALFAALRQIAVTW